MNPKILSLLFQVLYAAGTTELETMETECFDQNQLDWGAPKFCVAGKHTAIRNWVLYHYTVHVRDYLGLKDYDTHVSPHYHYSIQHGPQVDRDLS